MTLSKLYLELTDRCNLACTICYRHGWQEPETDMPAWMFKSLVREIQSLPQIKTIVLGGIGEPTCSPVFPDALDILRDRALILTTNGEFGPELVQPVCASTRMVVLSLDGLSHTHRSIRGTSPDRLAENVAGLREQRRRTGIGPQIVLQCVLSTDTVQDALPLVDHAADLGADGLVFSHLMPQSLENRDKILYALPQGMNPELQAPWKPTMTDCRRLFDSLRIRALRRGIRLTLPPLTLKTERFCSFIEEASACVCASGAVVPCYRLSHGGTEYVHGRRKVIKAHAFGNLKDHPLLDIWESEAYHLFRQRVFGGRYPSCPDCDLVDGCEYVTSSEADCWCATPSCADCLWSRRLIQCP